MLTDVEHRRDTYWQKSPVGVSPGKEDTWADRQGGVG